MLTERLPSQRKGIKPMKNMLKRIVTFVTASAVASSLFVSVSALKVSPGSMTVLDFSDKSNYNVTTSKTEKEDIVIDKTKEESKQFTTEFINKYFRIEEEEYCLDKTPVKSVYYVTKEMTDTDFIEYLDKYLLSEKIINEIPGEIKLSGSLEEFKKLIKEIIEDEEKIIDVGKGELDTRVISRREDYTFPDKDDIFSEYTDSRYKELYGDEASPDDPDYIFKRLVESMAKSTIKGQIMNECDEWYSENSELIHSSDEYSECDGDKWIAFWYWLKKYIDNETLTPETAKILFNTEEKYKFWIWLIDNRIIEYTEGYTSILPEIWKELKDMKILTSKYKLKDAIDKIEYIEKLYKIKKLCEMSIEEEKVNITYITEINAKSDAYRKVHSGTYLSNYEWYIYSDKGFLEHHVTTNAPWLSFVPSHSSTTYTAVCYQSKEDTLYKYFDYCKDYYAYMTDTGELIYSSRIEGSKLIDTSTTVIQEKLGEIKVEVGESSGGITLKVNDFGAGFATERIQ